jgi:lipid A 4'-phosphatase
VNRTGLIVVLFCALSCGLVLGLYPAIDLSIAEFFHNTANPNSSALTRELVLTASALRRIASWIEILLIVPPLIALIAKLILPRTKLLMPGRSILFLIASFALGPGLLVNVALKDHWERPKPGDLMEFGGTQHFIPWWQPHGDCRKNCAFVSGEASGAFWTLAPAALAPLPLRPLAYAAAITFGVAVSVSRIIIGGHFLSDAIFAGVFTFVIIWLAYAVIYRWPLTRLDDKTIEAALEAVSDRTRATLDRFRGRSADQKARGVTEASDEPH